MQTAPLEVPQPAEQPQYCESAACSLRPGAPHAIHWWASECNPVDGSSGERCHCQRGGAAAAAAAWAAVGHPSLCQQRRVPLRCARHSRTPTLAASSKLVCCVAQRWLLPSFVLGAPSFDSRSCARRSDSRADQCAMTGWSTYTAACCSPQRSCVFLCSSRKHCPESSHVQKGRDGVYTMNSI